MGEPDGKIPLEYRDPRPERTAWWRGFIGDIAGFVFQAILELGLAAFVILGLPIVVLFCMKSCSKHP